MWSYRIYNTNKEAKQINVTPSSKEQVKLGLFNRVEISGDENLKPGNIKKDVKIFGVTGTLEKTSGGSGAVTYTVTFDSNGGSEISSQEIVDGYQAKRPEDPILTGGKFETWLLNGEPFDFSTPIIEDITLTAKWLEQLVNYKMIYDGGLNQTENWSEDTGGFSLVENHTGIGKLTTNTGNLTISGVQTLGWGGYMMFCAMSNNKIDLIDYKLLCSLCDITLGGSSSPYYAFLRARATNNFPGYSTMFNGDDVSTDTTNTTYGTQNTTANNLLLDCNIENASTAYVYLGIKGEDGRNKAVIRNMFLFKQDNWQELCSIAGLDPDNYTDEVSLCANSEAINAILQNEDAVNYMTFFCTGTFMYNFIRVKTNLNAINTTPYYDIIYTNEHWSKFINLVS